MDRAQEFAEVMPFRAMEFLLGIYAKRYTREDARKRVELMETCGPSDLVWFDIRWPP